MSKKVVVDVEKAITLLKSLVEKWQEEEKAWDNIREKHDDDIPYNVFKDRAPDEVAYEVLCGLLPIAEALGLEVKR